MNTGNASLVKDINKKIILNTIKDLEPISRADLVKKTQLALPTVLRIVNEMVEEKIVVEIGKGETLSGRKPIMLKINPELGFYFGVRIGRKLVIIMTDFKGNVLKRKKEDTDFKSGPEGAIMQTRRLIDETLKEMNLSYDKVEGIGLATPGTRFKTGVLFSESSFYGWENTDYEKLLTEAFPGILSKAENTTICGAVGEQWFGVCKNIENYIYIFIDAGVGGGVIVDGKIYRGKYGFAGHIGHHVVNFEGPFCYCGNRGCLESYISSVAIIKEIAERIKAGEYSILDTGEKLTFSSIAEASRKGDALANDVIIKAGAVAGIGIANAINMYDPDLVILGGEVSNQCPEFVQEAVRMAKENTFSLKAKDTRIIVSEIEEYPEAFGAIALVMNERYKMPNI